MGVDSQASRFFRFVSFYVFKVSFFRLQSFRVEACRLQAFRVHFRLQGLEGLG